MGNTWIVDIRHYLDPSGAFADMPSRARLLAEYFTHIVVDATTNIDDEPNVRCRRRPGRRPCTGTIMSYPAADDLDRTTGTAPFVTTTDSSAAGKTRSGTVSPPTSALIEPSQLRASLIAYGGREVCG